MHKKSERDASQDLNFDPTVGRIRMQEVRVLHTVLPRHVHGFKAFEIWRPVWFNHGRIQIIGDKRNEYPSRLRVGGVKC